MADPKLPTLEELRARRRQAMQRATRRIVPAALLGGILEVPAAVGLWMAHNGRATMAGVLPMVAGSLVASCLWLTAIIVLHVKRNVPEELRRADLLCHACGEPLVVRPAAAGTRTIPSDPAMRALMEGRCASCKAVVVRDLPQLTGALPDQPTLNSSRARA
ncbi:MAG TPA: hypothetical protein VHM30_17930 [Gemmatimonadaceae bacterium]|nr:hypothetical protein [Gemmatimonadaceae bacterium]